MKDCFFYKRDGIITNKSAVRKLFDGLEDGTYYLKIESKKKRTLSQNAYLHGVIIPLVLKGLRDMGWNAIRDEADAKTVIKTMFLKHPIYNEATCEEIEVVKRTRDLTTKEMADFIDEVVQWSSEYLGVVIPAPGEQMILYGE